MPGVRHGRTARDGNKRRRRVTKSRRVLLIGCAALAASFAAVWVAGRREPNVVFYDASGRPVARGYLIGQPGTAGASSFDCDWSLAWDDGTFPRDATRDGPVTAGVQAGMIWIDLHPGMA